MGHRASSWAEEGEEETRGRGKCMVSCGLPESRRGRWPVWHGRVIVGGERVEEHMGQDTYERENIGKREDEPGDCWVNH